ncbi:hypothetical protein COU54_02135 [Candidatus Pacearchaeota archaeon CG10_big_fil_rev_8_21_14_0_10_31_24]|nr:MAG: hypothetical protein COU54_02135 [Candidatus Pacearchaeota archaeon CG10_big_fil_rev_8_21_14_0_10_31_24]
MIKSINSKRAALELSIGTIVILVLGITMLIMGLVVTRSIMCGALGLTDEVSGKANSELNTLFQSTEGEVVCIGQGGDPVKLVPGKLNVIHCSVNAPESAKYDFEVTSAGTSISSLKEETIKSWLTTNKLSIDVAPGDKDSKKPIRIDIPENAPEGNVNFIMTVKKDGNLLITKDLDFEISRVGFVRSATC